MWRLVAFMAIVALAGCGAAPTPIVIVVTATPAPVATFPPPTMLPQPTVDPIVRAVLDRQQATRFAAKEAACAQLAADFRESGGTFDRRFPAAVIVEQYAVLRGIDTSRGLSLSGEAAINRARQSANACVN